MAELNSQSKQAEQERSTLVRQLLINLENLRESVLEAEELPAAAIKREDPIIEEAVLSREKAERKRSGNVVNLNLEAEKTYKARTLSRCPVKRPSPFVAAH
jgi:hypothetical protein